MSSLRKEGELFMTESISYNEYLTLMGRICGWLIKNHAQFKKRLEYGYFGKTLKLGALEKTALEHYEKNTFLANGLFAEYVECAIEDNKDLSFLPNYVTSKSGVKYNKATYVDMAKRVAAYEVQNKSRPNIVYLKGNATSTNNTAPSSSLKPYLTNTGCAGMGQCTPYYCACNSLQQCFYRLTGIQVPESTLAAVMGTTTAGTGHQGINTGVAWFNKKYNQNIKIVWKNFSDLGSNDSERWSALQSYINKGAVFCHLNYRLNWGHYEIPKAVNGSNLTILNSLGNRCHSPAYCGYIETRSKANQLAYMKGISQKSIAILTKG